MIIKYKFCFLFFCFNLINAVFCGDFKCPVKGKIGELKVPNVLNLMNPQNGYHAAVEVTNPRRNNLVYDYYEDVNKAGFVDLEAKIQDKMNRRYYYHFSKEKIAVRENTCTRLDLDDKEKVESVKDWFEPTDIVASSEMFKDFIHLGPTSLMIYANKISDKASFIGSEVFEGRSVNHWFYCTNDNGPYIDFYFDVKTSSPYRFSLYYPEWIETQEFISENETRTVKKQVDSESKYVYNFFKFKPLVITSQEPIPYPLGYGCRRKDAQPSTPLPDFSQVNQFTMDMEAVISYSDRDPIKSTARVMKRGDVISYEIQEETFFVRSIEMPPPLGRYEVDQNTGKCQYLTSDYGSDATLITRWPFHEDRGFNLFYYLVMKPTSDHAPTFIGEIPLGPYRVEEYRAARFFSNSRDAIVDYFYPNNFSTSVPSKVLFTPDPSAYYYYAKTPSQVEVTIINYEDGYLDYEDRFDISGCYEKPGNFTWFQLLFSNPWINHYDLETIKELVEDYLTSFIPIIRIGPIHVQKVFANLYVTVKLYDRVHFIDAYGIRPRYTLSNPSNTVKRFTIEDCEQLCSSESSCSEFSYCDNYDCSFNAGWYGYYTTYNEKCVFRSRSSSVDVKPFVSKNYLSTMTDVLQQIRHKVTSGQFYLSVIGLAAEDLFIVSGPDEIGDVSRDVQRKAFSKPLRSEDFPIIKTDRNFNEAQFKIDKVTLNDCFMACLNDDDCNTLSYCVNDNKECILSKETSSSLKDTIDGKTSHADGCNIYEKSYINSFHEYSGKTLVLDAMKTMSNISIGDCAQACAQSKDFNCESFDYCQESNQKDDSACFLHVNHIEFDKAHEINITNWKVAQVGCSHYSKKSELDYEHKVGLALRDEMKDSIVGTFDHLSLEHCASKCNLDSNCFTFQFCEKINYDQMYDSSFSLSSCSLTNLKPRNVDQPKLFQSQSRNDKICSIYTNHNKIAGKSTDNSKAETSRSTSLKKSNNYKLAIGLGTMIFIIAFVGGFVGFLFASRKGMIL